MAQTAAQVINLACQIAKCPAYTAQALQFLNTVLQQLAQDYDFDVIRKTYDFNFNTSGSGLGYAVGSGPNPMPADFLRAHKKGAFYKISDVPYTMVGVEQSEFDQFVTQAGNASYPSMFYVDVAPMSSGAVANLYCWAPASGAFAATIRYNPQMPDITDTSTTPWFPNSDYLIEAVAARLMNITNDDRLTTFRAMSEDTLTKYLKMKDDPETAAKRVGLDPRMFGNSNWNRLPNTKRIGW